ncbi:MAG TPA: polysaccharide pyruvyl transferase family protein, partial [Lachnospiraceae bacterium]|nr:polysaccharide pyruvyl transferase family protein [Lachnospiraceae bacterium]
EQPNNGDMFTYVLDKSPQKETIINGIAAKAGMKRYECMPKNSNATYLGIKKHGEDYVYPSVTKWLRSFIDAKLVVTDSFHGTAFSIIFNKPFFVLINKERGAARFTSLLHLFGLEDRIITSAEEADMKKAIDWDAVNAKKKKWQEESKTFLENALKK